MEIALAGQDVSFNATPAMAKTAPMVPRTICPPGATISRRSKRTSGTKAAKPA